MVFGEWNALISSTGAFGSVTHLGAEYPFASMSVDDERLSRQNSEGIFLRGILRPE